MTTGGLRDSSGYLVCQVVGCTEYARPWTFTLAWDTGLEIEVQLCPRHDRELHDVRGMRNGADAPAAEIYP